MDSRLAETLSRSGANLAPETSRPADFGDPAAELQNAFDGCVLADRSHFVRLLAVGKDYLGLLHRLSTGDVGSLSAGQGKPTILTSSKGRIVERLFVHHLGSAGVISVAGPGSASRVLQHFKRYTFAEKTGLTDETQRTFQLALIGPQASGVLAALAWPRPEPYLNSEAAIDGTPLHLLGQDGTSSDGFSVVGPLERYAAAWQLLAEAVGQAGGRAAGDDALEAYRVLRGLPMSGHELTEDDNPLEAGQWDAVDFDKGCYVGQEVVARLRTYDKISRELVGLEFDGDPPACGTPLLEAGSRIGRLTSAVRSPDRPLTIGLAYVKRRAIRPGLELRVGTAGDAATARVIQLPFPRSPA